MDFEKWYDLNEEQLLADFIKKKRERIKRHILLCDTLNLEFEKFVKETWTEVVPGKKRK